MLHFQMIRKVLNNKYKAGVNAYLDKVVNDKGGKIVSTSCPVLKPFLILIRNK